MPPKPIQSEENENGKDEKKDVKSDQEEKKTGSQTNH